MFSSTTHDNGSIQTLELSGELTLEHCTELHALLSEHQHMPALRLDFRNASRMDLTFLQLLQALMRSIERDGRRLLFAPLPDLMISMGAALGAESLLKKIIAQTEEAL